LGVYASADYLRQRAAPREVSELNQHKLIGYVEEYAFSAALDYVREIYDGQPTQFECASAVTQLEALRAGVGLGVVHDYIARKFPDLLRVLPERRASRAYWIVTHEDTRALGRIRAAQDHIVACVERDRGMFI
jgi:DNA-binding transcriptional LysR family regulator